MSAAVADLLRVALELPEEQRLYLASRLIASVHEAQDEGWQSAWLEELDQRLERARQDETRGDEWSSVRDRLLARLGPQ